MIISLILLLKMSLNNQIYQRQRSTWTFVYSRLTPSAGTKTGASSNLNMSTARHTSRPLAQLLLPLVEVLLLLRYKLDSCGIHRNDQYSRQTCGIACMVCLGRPLWRETVWWFYGAVGYATDRRYFHVFWRRFPPHKPFLSRTYLHARTFRANQLAPVVFSLGGLQGQTLQRGFAADLRNSLPIENSISDNYFTMLNLS